MKLEPMTREGVTRMLRAHGITPTHQRIEIALVLFEKPWHPSADQILAAVNVRYAETSKATVYNTLGLFLDKGLVRELIVDPIKVFYDANTSEHHHFYDVSSGAITDIAAEGVRIDGLPPLPAGMVADGIDIVVRTRPGF
ncbi:MAG: transcriptional repressor [Betaproteobacteria bacterium]|nr:MAG: transcriptional repressor [Betaproteobacteria bacterium]